MCAADANLQKAVVTVPLAIVVFASAHAACVLQKSEAKVRVSLRFFCDLGVTAEQHSCVCVPEARNLWSQFCVRCLCARDCAHMCSSEFRSTESVVTVPLTVLGWRNRAHVLVAERRGSHGRGSGRGACVCGNIRAHVCCRARLVRVLHAVIVHL